MDAFAGVGFSNLAELQGEIVKLIPGVSSRIEKSLRAINHRSLPSGIVIYSYFERIPTGRAPIHIRISDNNRLMVRLDVVAPYEDATAEEMLDHFLLIWSEMVSKLARYLERKQVPNAVAQSVTRALSLPAP